MNDQMYQQAVQLVQAAMQGDKQATQQINQIMQAAKQGGQAGALAQMIQQVAQQMQGGGAQKAALGAKLNYLRTLNKQCPEGEELAYFAKGGCMKCMKKVEQAKCGKKMSKGGVSKAVNGIKAELAQKGTKTKTPDVAPTDTIHTSSKDKGYKPGTPLALTKKAEKAGYTPYPKQGRGLHQNTRQRAHIKDAEAGRE